MSNDLKERDESYRKSDRVLKRGVFLRAVGSDFSRKSKHFVVVELRDHVGERKLGITASRKIGNAVERNRVKRLIREFFRKNKDKLRKDTYFIVIARKNSPTLTYDLAYNELSRMMFVK